MTTLLPYFRGTSAATYFQALVHTMKAIWLTILTATTNSTKTSCGKRIMTIFRYPANFVNERLLGFPTREFGSKDPVDNEFISPFVSPIPSRLLSYCLFYPPYTEPFPVHSSGIIVLVVARYILPAFVNTYLYQADLSLIIFFLHSMIRSHPISRIARSKAAIVVKTLEAFIALLQVGSPYIPQPPKVFFAVLCFNFPDTLPCACSRVPHRFAFGEE